MKLKFKKSLFMGVFLFIYSFIFMSRASALEPQMPYEIDEVNKVITISGPINGDTEEAAILEEKLCHQNDDKTQNYSVILNPGSCLDSWIVPRIQINTLTINKDVHMISPVFAMSSIDKLYIENDAVIPQNVFQFSIINDIYIRSEAVIEPQAFSVILINKTLVIENNVKISNSSFDQAIIYGTIKVDNQILNLKEAHEKLGVLDLDASPSKCEFDEENNTFIFHGKLDCNSPNLFLLKKLSPEFVQKCTSIIIDSKSTIENNIFSYQTFDSLTIKPDAHIYENAFESVNVRNLKIEKGARIYEKAFKDAVILNLYIEEGAQIYPQAFVNCEILNSVKIDGTKDFILPNETFDHTKVSRGANITVGSQLTNNLTLLQPYAKHFTQKSKTLKGDIEQLGEFIKKNNYTFEIKPTANVLPNAMADGYYSTVVISPGANICENAFANSKVSTLIINKGAKIDKNAFQGATIVNLHIEEGAQIYSNEFVNCKILNSVKQIDKIKDFVPLDETFDNAKVNTDAEITVNSDLANNRKSCVKFCEQKNLFALKGDINRLVKADIKNFIKNNDNCTFNIKPNANVLPNAMADGSYSNVIVSSGAHLCENAFANSKIGKLVIKKGAEIDKNAFINSIITMLIIKQGAKVDENVFTGCKILNRVAHSNLFALKGDINQLVKADIKNFIRNNDNCTLNIKSNANVLPNAMADGSYGTVIVSSGAHLCENAFVNSKIGTLIIEQGTKINVHTFAFSQIDTLIIKKNAEIFKDVFADSKIGTLIIEQGSLIYGKEFLHTCIKKLIIKNADNKKYIREATTRREIVKIIDEITIPGWFEILFEG